MFQIPLNILRSRESQPIPILVHLVASKLKQNKDRVNILRIPKDPLGNSGTSGTQVLDKLIKAINRGTLTNLDGCTIEVCLALLKFFISKVPKDSLHEETYIHMYLMNLAQELADKALSFLEQVYPVESHEFINYFYNKNIGKPFYLSLPTDLKLKVATKLKDLQFGLLPQVDRGKRILSIDGGGMRGLFAIKMLEFIAIKLYGNAGAVGTQKLIDNFDMIGGTSVGAIIALGMVLGHSIIDLKKLFYDLGVEVFDNSWMRFPGNIYNYFKSGDYYNSKVLTDFLDKLYSTKKLSDVPTKVFIVSTAATEDPYEEYLFRSYDGSKGVSITNAIRASTAAPTYFAPYIDANGNVYIDGGLMSNNPTETAIFETANVFPDAKIDTILSIGTGRPRPEKTSNSIVSINNSIINIATNSELTHMRILEWIKDYAKDIGYFRFSPEDLGSIRLDTTNQHMLENGEILTERYMNNQILQIDNLKNSLNK